MFGTKEPYCQDPYQVLFRQNGDFGQAYIVASNGTKKSFSSKKFFSLLLLDALGNRRGPKKIERSSENSLKIKTLETTFILLHILRSFRRTKLNETVRSIPPVFLWCHFLYSKCIYTTCMFNIYQKIRCDFFWP